MVKNDWGIFIEVYGNTQTNRVWDYLLTRLELDFAIGDMAEEIKVSRPKAYELIEKFESKGYVIKSRVVGRTQLYKLKMDNKIVKMFRRNFMECLKLALDEETATSVIHTSTGIGSVGTKHF